MGAAAGESKERGASASVVVVRGEGYLSDSETDTVVSCGCHGVVWRVCGAFA